MDHFINRPTPEYKVSKMIRQNIGLRITITWWLVGMVFFAGERVSAIEIQDAIEVRVLRLTMDGTANQPVVLLSDLQENRAMVIWIGLNEARAIYSELNQIDHFRPLTHDLLEQMIHRLGGRVHHIVITEIKGNTFYARIMIEKDASLIEIDARPSDSIVMALKFKAPLFVAKSLFERASVAIGQPAPAATNYGLTLQNITPPLAEYLSYGLTHGAVVVDVRRGSRAEKDGLRPRDIIVEMDHQKIADAAAATDALHQSRGRINVRLYRANQYLNLNLNPATDPTKTE